MHSQNHINLTISDISHRVKSFVLTYELDSPHSRLIYLIPKPIRDFLLVPTPVVLRATSWHSPISISRHGKILLHSLGEGAVERHSHVLTSKKHQSLLESDLVSSCPGPEILSSPSNDLLIFSPASDSDVSATIYALPLSQSCNDKPIITSSVFSRFAQQTSIISLFFPDTRKFIIVDRASKDNLEISLFIGQRGGRCTISPVFDLNNSGKSEALQISIPGCTILPEFLVNETENPLPTPPASPRPRPRHSVSFVLPHDEILADADKKTATSAPSELESPTYSKPTSSSNTMHSSFQSGTPGILLNMQVAVFSRVHAFMMRGPIRAHIFAAFSMVTWLLGLFVRRAFSFSYSSFVRPLRRRAALNTSTASAAHESGGASRSRSGGANPVASSPPASSPSPTPSLLDATTSRVIKDTPSEKKVDSIPPASPPAPALRLGTRKTNGSADAEVAPLATPGGLRWQFPRESGCNETPLSLLVRSNTRQPTASSIVVEVDGQAALVSSIGEVGERVTLLELERTGEHGVGPFQSLVVKLGE